MKTVILIVALMLCLVGTSFGAEPNEPKNAVAFWVSGTDLGNQNTDLSAWLGFRRDNIEIGVATEWRMYAEGDTDADFQSNFSVGPYGVYHFPGLIDVNNPIDVEWLPDKLLGEPFLSLSYLIDTKGMGATISPGVGIRLLDVFAVMYQYSWYKGVPADNQGRIGLSVKWEF